MQSSKFKKIKRNRKKSKAKKRTDTKKYKRGKDNNNNHILKLIQKINNNINNETTLNHSSSSSFFSDAFLPIGFPHSVEKGYLKYQIWDLVQGLTSYFRGNLAMKETLKALGVGDVAANATSSALSKLILQGTSMFGGLIFTWMASEHFGRHTRQWRLFADVINDIGLTLQMVAPLCGKDYFLSISIVSTIALSMCGISAGATKASISNFFAKNDNLTDLVAKEGSQETAVNILGIIGGYFFLTLLNDNMYITWISFIILTLLHVFANIQAVQELKFKTINNCRLGLLYNSFSNGGNFDQMTIDKITLKEPYLFYWNTLSNNVKVGVEIEKMENTIHESELKESIKLSRKYKCHYLILPKKSSYNNNNISNTIDIVLDQHATQQDIFKAYFAGLSIDTLKNYNVENLNRIYSEIDFESFSDVLRRNHWNIHRINLSTVSNVRYNWVDKMN